MEETGVPGENNRPAASHWQILSQNVESSRPPLSRIQTHNVVVTGTDCIGSYNSHFNMITTTMALIQFTEFTSEHDEMFNK